MAQEHAPNPSAESSQRRSTASGRLQPDRVHRGGRARRRTHQPTLPVASRSGVGTLTTAPLRETTPASVGVVVVTIAELSETVRAAVEHGVAAALVEHTKPPAATLLSRNALAKQLGVSAATVDRQTNAGMPFILVGDRRRYELPAVLGWLRRDSHDDDGTH